MLSLTYPDTDQILKPDVNGVSLPPSLLACGPSSLGECPKHVSLLFAVAKMSGGLLITDTPVSHGSEKPSFERWRERQREGWGGRGRAESQRGTEEKRLQVCSAQTTTNSLLNSLLTTVAVNRPQNRSECVESATSITMWASQATAAPPWHNRSSHCEKHNPLSGHNYWTVSASRLYKNRSPCEVTHANTFFFLKISFEMKRYAYTSYY